MIGLATKKRDGYLICPYQPLPWQYGPWACTDQVMLLTGSAGGGKSRLAAEKIHAYCLRYPGAMGLMLRKTRESMTNSTVLFMSRSVVGDDPRVRHYPSKSRFEYANGSVLAYGGMADEHQREQIRSIGPEGNVDIVWMEEANRFTENDFNEVLARMRGTSAPWGQIILSCNPDAPTHWIYQRLIMGAQGTVFYSKAADNTYNPPSYLETLQKLTGVLGARLRDGKWVQAEGAVYEEFDPAIHMLEPFAIPADWRRIRAVDFGFTNPFVCQWWAIDGDGRMYLYRELYQTQTLVEDHARRIFALTGGERIEATVADHDAEDRATLQRYGVGTVPAEKSISPGIQAVQQRLRVQDDGKPRLFIFRNALVGIDMRLEDAKLPTNTADEFIAYTWPRSTDGRPVKEVPVQVNDHGMDALRYAVMYADKGRMKMRVVTVESSL